MIHNGKGSIFDSVAEALVNPVNCVGVMGGGLALGFRHRYPAMHEQYLMKCQLGMIKIGGELDVFVEDATNRDFVINLPTKDHWKDPSKYEYIIDGLNKLIDAVDKWKINSVAIPALGCGLGGLDWRKVYSLIKELDVIKPNVDWIVYGPQ